MWNLADYFEEIAARIPDEPTIVDDDRVLTWAGFERVSESLAADLASRGTATRAPGTR